MTYDVPATGDAACNLPSDPRAFVAAVSHELRTPLTALAGVLRLLDEQTLPAEAAALIRTAREAADMLGGIAGALVDAASIEAGRFQIAAEPLDVRALLESVTALHGPAAQAKGLRLRAEVVDAPTAILGDGLRLRQVLGNLVSNAVRATETGGVLVRARRGTRAETLRFEVADTGPGLPPQATARLFTPFATAHATEGGTGLGLVIARQLVEAMGGSLRAHSRLGQGTVFAVIVPAPPSAAPAPVAHTFEPAPPMKILVVDDNAINRQLLTLLLARDGHTITTESGGGAALARLDRESFDAVLLDLAMPDINGQKVFAAMQARGGATAAIPVIAVTAHALPSERDKCLAAGFADFVSKPIDLLRLRAALAAVAQRQAAAA